MCISKRYAVTQSLPITFLSSPVITYRFAAMASALAANI